MFTVVTRGSIQLPKYGWPENRSFQRTQNVREIHSGTANMGQALWVTHTMMGRQLAGSQNISPRASKKALGAKLGQLNGAVNFHYL